jgi:hypothetical protein
MTQNYQTDLLSKSFRKYTLIRICGMVLASRLNSQPQGLESNGVVPTWTVLGARRKFSKDPSVAELFEENIM